MKNNEPLHKIQLTLNNALNYWLYVSLSNRSLKNTVSLRFYLSSKPILQCISAFQEADIFSSGLTSYQLLSDQISAKRYAKLLAKLYQVWEQNVPKTAISSSDMPKGQNYKNWLAHKGSEKCYWPVHSLRQLLCSNYANFFRRSILHGSIATLDDTRGFSDMDLAFVVRISVLKNPEKLLALRKIAAKILTLTFAFDPFMHHGPYYISEIDLAWYPEAMFPSVLFRYGVDLLEDSHPLEIKTRLSKNHTDQMLKMFDDFFQQWASKPFMLKNCYDIEWVLGSAMLLPALYLQRCTGVFRYKRDTFALAAQDFSPEEWEPIRIATELRGNIGPRPKPSMLLFWLALRLRWPGLLQYWARSHPVSLRRAKEVNKVLGTDYPKQVLHLLKSMRNKVRDKSNIV